ncbi:hypothetical protein BDY19DRAFT_990844 [Irpex rosettiformis]|uniref:Uncharacterized protein n=1 Tax=Irpex rosettiformis TaxID=378272 RepID=A0ACB8UCQ9_9APHY|nr:hypothetical protein BDY19DRAFT_990844 [Irpex rosettiformis]
MSRTNLKRRSTVHDLASLRLHPDGSKIANSESNFQLRKAKRATKDTRGNWIAHDAGGLDCVKTRRATKKTQDRTEATGVDGGNEGEAGSSLSAVDKDMEANEDGVHEDGEYIPKDIRAKKRKAFIGDFAFLEGPASSTPDIIPRPSTEESSYERILLPPPSSDLLKCIHHFASNHYTETDQLRDSSREYREKKKRRKLAMNKQGKRSTSDDSQKEAEGNQRSSSSSSSSEDDKELQQERKGNKGRVTACPSRREKRRSYNPGDSKVTTDMYKVCDGSALLAIGMLLQQHVVNLLSPRIPEGWEDAMIDQGNVLPVAYQHDSGMKSLQPVDDGEEALYSNKSEDETEEDALMDRIEGGLGDEDYVPN